MTSTKTLLLAAAFAVPAMIASAPVQAQVSGIAVADPEAAVANSRAWQAARGQIQTTYKAQLDQADVRRRAVTAELQPLVTAYQNAARQPGASEASLRPQAQALQTRENAANQELARLTEPAQRAQAYALEQISRRLNEAVQGAVRARNVTLLLRPAAALFSQPTADITPAITAELDRLVPTVATTPPAGWQPGQQGAAGAPAAPGARPATTAPTTPAPRPQGR